MHSLATERFPVTAEGKLVGMAEGSFSGRKVADFGHDPKSIRVGHSMSNEKFYCLENQLVEEARKIMFDNGLKHPPVVDVDLHVVGTVSLENLKKC